MSLFCQHCFFSAFIWLSRRPRLPLWPSLWHHWPIFISYRHPGRRLCLAFPHALFGGYGFLHALLANNVLPTLMLLGFVALKTGTASSTINITELKMEHHLSEGNKTPPLAGNDDFPHTVMGPASVFAAAFRLPLPTLHYATIWEREFIVSMSRKSRFVGDTK